MPVYQPASEYKRLQHPGTRRPASPSFLAKSIRLVVALALVFPLFYLVNVRELPRQLREGISEMTTNSGYKKCIVYHTDWANYARNFQVTNLATFMGGITDVCYAFMNLQVIHHYFLAF